MMNANGVNFTKRFVQSVFEKMADTFEGEVVLHRWWEDGSATISLDGDGYSMGFRIWDCPNESGFNLARVRRVNDPLEILVTPIPSVIIAIVTR